MVTLDQETHTYRTADGVVVPGVTSILKPLVTLSGIPRDVLERKRDLGQRVHAACHYFSEGDLDESSVEPDVAPYLDAFRRFVAESGIRIVANELIVHDPVANYAGQLDLIGDIGRMRWLIDLKSCAQLPFAVGPQTAAYARAHSVGRQRPPIDCRGALRLQPDRRFRLVPLRDPDDWAVFTACQTLYRYHSKHGKDLE